MEPRRHISRQRHADHFSFVFSTLDKSSLNTHHDAAEEDTVRLDCGNQTKRIHSKRKRERRGEEEERKDARRREINRV